MNSGASKEKSASIRLEFCRYDEAFLEKSWAWLNDPEIKQLTMTPDFTREDQARWFSRLPQMADYLIWGMKVQGEPIGSLGLKHITKNDAEYWGYIGERQFWGAGLGDQMMSFAFKKAKELGLREIHLRVHRDNVRAAKLYQRVGFVVEREDGNQNIMRLKLDASRSE